MKKAISALVATAALTIAASALAASIVDSKHNLSNTSDNTYKGNTTEVCVFCHTPHNPSETRALWNRTNPSTSFTLYTSGANVESADWYVKGVKTLPTDSPSLLCLSCHDGTMSLAALKVPPIEPSTGLRSTTGLTMSVDKLSSTNTANLGTTLTNDHPISLVYATVQAAIPDTLNAADANGLVGPAKKLPLAKRANLECNTCHNVHDNALPPFLRVSMDGSKLCLECHIK